MECVKREGSQDEPITARFANVVVIQAGPLPFRRTYSKEEYIHTLSTVTPHWWVSWRQTRDGTIFPCILNRGSRRD
jgi:hypothetical protein